jgi:hypothetical protein
MNYYNLIKHLILTLTMTLTNLLTSSKYVLIKTIPMQTFKFISIIYLNLDLIPS